MYKAYIFVLRKSIGEIMARPKKVASEVKQVVALRLTPKIKKALQRAAADESRSASGLAEHVLSAWLKERGYVK
jgi:hypothetical protein